jgi:hypothetical protein
MNQMNSYVLLKKLPCILMLAGFLFAQDGKDVGSAGNKSIEKNIKETVYTLEITVTSGFEKRANVYLMSIKRYCRKILLWKRGTVFLKILFSHFSLTVLLYGASAHMSLKP